MSEHKQTKQAHGENHLKTELQTAPQGTTPGKAQAHLTKSEYI
jgi:hypothetical protein